MGILAHVDAGKTTLSECLLYHAGVIKEMGRVDKKDSYLDNFEAERRRGITIYAKQANMTLNGRSYTLLDTPGHVDFSPETERVLSVLDFCVLLINGASGVQSHSKTLWSMLERLRVPTIIFVNKMDQDGTDAKALRDEIRTNLSSDAETLYAPTGDISEAFFETCAQTDEELLNEYLINSTLPSEVLQKAFVERKVFPILYGSALKDSGVDKLIDAVSFFAEDKAYPVSFGARVFKITQDADDGRLTTMKVTGGSLRIKDVIGGIDREGNEYQEKVNRLYILSGDKKEAVNEVLAGQVCSVAGLENTFIGAGLGTEENHYEEMMVPVVTYAVHYESTTDKVKMYSYLKSLEEEEPALHVTFDEETGEIKVSLMGEVQIEILKEVLRNRFLVNVDFTEGRILYRETIDDKVEGVGHFEPLRHYAEVHVLMEPLERGSGIEYDSIVSTDELAQNWQNLIMTHLKEKVHKGVLTGSPLTDVKFTLCSGKAHLKHTMGGDFRQATYRAVRHGLMYAKSRILEPYFKFEITVPDERIGHVMTMLTERAAKFEAPTSRNGMSTIEGTGPVSTLTGFKMELNKTCGGNGDFAASVIGYFDCHNEEEVIERIGYDPERDIRNPSSSVFCQHGAGTNIPWNEVKDYMHLPMYEEGGLKEPEVIRTIRQEENKLSPEEQERELKSIFESTYGTIKTKFNNDSLENDNLRYGWNGRPTPVKEKGPIRREKPEDYDYDKEQRHKHDAASKSNTKKNRYLLVDGYNVIFAWKSLADIVSTNMDGARDALAEILCNYGAYTGMHVILVFDAYKLKEHKTEVLKYRNIHIVYTATAETADQYIEKCAYSMRDEHDVTCVTSDGLEQVIIIGSGCNLISSREFEKETKRVSNEINDDHIALKADTGSIKEKLKIPRDML